MAKKMSEADMAYIRRFNDLAGDTSGEWGVKMVRKGLINHCVCRLCGEVIPFKEANTIDKLTGYCARCMRTLNRKAAAEAQAALAGRQITAKVKGISFREDAVREVLGENEDYKLTKKQIQDEDLEGERIYELDSTIAPAKLVPEPDNQDDPNAVAVYVYGEHLGYVPRGMAAEIRGLLEADAIEGVKADICGGPYKILEDGELLKDEIPFSCTLTITKKAN